MALAFCRAVAGKTSAPAHRLFRGPGGFQLGTRSCNNRQFRFSAIFAASPQPAGEPQPQNASDGDSNSWRGGLKQLLLKYDTLLKNRPITTKACTSFLGFAMGDYLAQGIEGVVFDAWRQADGLLYAIKFGVLCIAPS